MTSSEYASLRAGDVLLCRRTGRKRVVVKAPVLANDWTALERVNRWGPPVYYTPIQIKRGYDLGERLTPAERT